MHVLNKILKSNKFGAFMVQTWSTTFSNTRTWSYLKCIVIHIEKYKITE